MDRYIKKVEELVEEKLKEKPKKNIDKQVNGLLSKKNKIETETDNNENIDLIEIIAENVAYIRRKRMELKENGTTI